MVIKDASGTLAFHVAATLDALPQDAKDEKDAALRAMARKYADVIDNSSGHCRECTNPECRKPATNAWTMRWIAPLLQQCLEALGATPVSRAALNKNKPAPKGQSKLQAMRDARGA